MINKHYPYIGFQMHLVYMEISVFSVKVINKRFGLSKCMFIYRLIAVKEIGAATQLITKGFVLCLMSN